MHYALFSTPKVDEIWITFQEFALCKFDSLPRWKRENVMSYAWEKKKKEYEQNKP